MKNSHLLILALLLAVSPTRAAEDEAADPNSPEAELATFTIADGFDVSLFASEADGVIKPIQIRFDARGRLWVAGSTVYPQVEPGQKADDKILILEDTDGDGGSDKTTVFADGLMIPTGLELTTDGGAYIGHGNQLLFLKDTDGDDKADERRVILRGFGTGDSHQNINSFAWGPGGELWMCQGLSIFSRVETPWGIVRLDRAGIWRLFPKRMKLEPFYGGHHDPQNPWGFVFTDFGEPIVLAGNNSAPIYPVPGLVPNRKDAAPTVIWRNGNGRKVSGGDTVGTTHFPKSWQDALILGGYINNTVWALNILDDGSGFVLEDREQPLITSSSVSFRPVDVKFGPDGALYVCDWYNPIIGHYQNSFRDPNRDKTRGRIWRVTAKGRPLTKKPELVGQPIPQLLDHLKSSDRWTRHYAKRVLADAPREDVIAELAKWTRQEGLSELALKEALGVYQSHEAVEPKLLERLAGASKASARAYAAGVVGVWADRLDDPLSLLRPLVADANARVRLQAVVSCASVRTPEAIEVAMVAADHPTDKFIDYALAQVVHSLKPLWAEALAAGKLGFDNQTNRIAALVKADGTPDTLQSLRNLVQSPELDAAAREAFLRILADIGDSNDLSAIIALNDPALQARLLPALAQAAELRGVTPAGDLSSIVKDLLGRQDEALRAGALRLAAAWKLAELRETVRTMAEDSNAPAVVRQAAIAAMPEIAGAEAQAVLMKLAGDESSPPIRGSAIAALATVDITAAAQQAAKFLSAGAPDAEAAELFHALLERNNAAGPLVAAFGATRPSPDAAKIGLRVMSASGKVDEALWMSLTDAAGLMSEKRELSEAELAALATEVTEQGDAARGAQIFLRAEMGCVACHAVNGQGGKTGPDLGTLGTAQPVSYIIDSILNPGQFVKEGYESVEVVTHRGASYQAYVLREDAQELVIRDIAKDQEVRLRQDAIAARTPRGSVMPPGLADMLTRAELRDLIKYLSEQGKAGNAPGEGK